jgi:hypothetical protein
MFPQTSYVGKFCGWSHMYQLIIAVTSGIDAKGTHIYVCLNLMSHAQKDGSQGDFGLCFTLNFLCIVPLSCPFYGRYIVHILKIYWINYVYLLHFYCGMRVWMFIFFLIFSTKKKKTISNPIIKKTIDSINFHKIMKIHSIESSFVRYYNFF